MTSTTSPRRAFVVLSALLFAASAVATIIACRTMSMVWMRMPGQTWVAAAASFLGMWVVMMVAMMLPSLAPMLWRARLGRYTAFVGAGYFFVWTVIGAAVYPLGAVWSAMAMEQPALARAAPIAVGVVVVIAAALQFTVCRRGPERESAPLMDAGAAWGYGLRLGFDCAWCCAGYMAIFVVIGVTDLVAMAIVTAAITIQRLSRT